jgi:methionyl-tRNA formyltransferase
MHCLKALNLLAKKISHHCVKIIFSQQVGNKKNLPDDLVKMKNFERREINDFRKVSAANGFEILDYQGKINDKVFLSQIKNYNFDLIISIRFGQIFKNEICKIPRYGIINLHSGILPNYRGVLASFWSILNNEKTLGTTLHYINDATIDTGNIIAFSKNKIDWNLPLTININNLYDGGCNLILQHLNSVVAGKIIPSFLQKEFGYGAYFSYPTQKDLQKFIQKMSLF